MCQLIIDWIWNSGRDQPAAWLQAMAAVVTFALLWKQRSDSNRMLEELTKLATASADQAKVLLETARAQNRPALIGTNQGKLLSTGMWIYEVRNVGAEIVELTVGVAEHEVGKCRCNLKVHSVPSGHVIGFNVFDLQPTKEPSGLSCALVFRFEDRLGTKYSQKANCTNQSLEFESMLNTNTAENDTEVIT